MPCVLRSAGRRAEYLVPHRSQLALAHLSLHLVVAPPECQATSAAACSRDALVGADPLHAGKRFERAGWLGATCGKRVPQKLRQAIREGGDACAR